MDYQAGWRFVPAGTICLHSFPADRCPYLYILVADTCILAAKVLLPGRICIIV